MHVAKKDTRIKRPIGDRTFDALNVLIMLVLCAVTLYPFLYVISMSFGGSSNIRGLIPSNPTLSAYQRVLGNRNIATGFYNSIFRTVFGSAATLMVTCGAAYGLSKKRFPNRGFWTAFCIFTMFFSGGLIPSYLLIKNLGLLDNRLALILPILMSTYNMTIMRNFFMALPNSLEESAMIDGANDIVILIRIIVPVSMPIIATIALWTAVGHWNAWFDSMIYMQSTGKQVLQQILRRIVIEGTTQLLDMNINSVSSDLMTASPDAVKGATIVITSLPIIMVYPFLQKYFVKGVMVGSLKG